MADAVSDEEGPPPLPDMLEVLDVIEANIGTPDMDSKLAALDPATRATLDSFGGNKVQRFINFNREFITAERRAAAAGIRNNGLPEGAITDPGLMDGLIRQWQLDMGADADRPGYRGEKETIFDRIYSNEDAISAINAGATFEEVKAIVDQAPAGPTGPRAEAPLPPIDKAAAGVAATTPETVFHRVKGTGDYTVTPAFDHDRALQVFGQFSGQGAAGIIDIQDFDTVGEVNGLQAGLVSIGLYPEAMAGDGKVGPYTMYGASALNGYAQVTQNRADNTMDAARQTQITAFYDKYKGPDGKLTVEDLSRLPPAEMRAAQTELKALGLDVGPESDTFNPRMAGGVGWVAGAQAGIAYNRTVAPPTPEGEPEPVDPTLDGQNKIVLVVDDTLDNGAFGRDEALRNRTETVQRMRQQLGPDNVVVVNQSAITREDGSLDSQRFGDIIAAAGQDGDGARVAYVSSDTVKYTGNSLNWGDSAGFARVYGVQDDNTIEFDQRAETIRGKDARDMSYETFTSYNEDSQAFLVQMRDSQDARVRGVLDKGVVVTAYSGDDTAFSRDAIYGTEGARTTGLQDIERGALTQLRGGEGYKTPAASPGQVAPPDDRAEIDADENTQIAAVNLDGAVGQTNVPLARQLVEQPAEPVRRADIGLG